MKIKYLGTAAAEGIPGMFCRCEVCEKARKLGGKRIRTRSQSIIDGVLGIDFPPDAYHHALVHGINYADVHDYIITHGHRDHFYAPDFLNIRQGFAHLAENEPTFNVYSVENLAEPLAQALDLCKGQLTWTPMEYYKTCHVGGYSVTPLRANHNTEFPSIYIISRGGKTLLYAHDTGFLLDEVWQYLEREKPHFDFMSLDTTLAANPEADYSTHMTLGMNLELLERMRSLGCADEKTIVCANHFSHNGGHADYEEFKEIADKHGILTSYDGMEVEF